MDLTAASLVVKIGGDATGAKQAVVEANQALATLGTQATQAGAGVQTAMGQVTAGAKQAQGGLESLVRSSAFQQLARDAQLAGVALAGALGAATKTAVDFDQSMRNVNSIAQLSEGAFARLQQQVLQLTASPEIRQGPRDLARGLYDVVSSGFQGAKALDVLKEGAKGASAGMTDTATSTRVLMAVLNSGIPGVKNAHQAMNVLFKEVDLGVNTFGQLANALGTVLPTAKTAGVSLQEIAAGLVVMTRQGISVDESVTALNQLLIHIIKPGKEARTLMNELGIQFGVTALESKGLAGWLKDVEEKTGGNKQAITQLVPEVRGMKAILALTDEQGRKYTEALDGMARANAGLGAEQRALNQQLKGAGADWDMFKKELELTGITAGQALLPALKEVLSEIRSGLQWFRDLNPETQTTAIRFTAISAAALILGGRIAGLVKLFLDLKGAMGGAGGASTAFGGGLATVGGPLAGLAISRAAGAPAPGSAFFDAAQHLLPGLLGGGGSQASSGGLTIAPGANVHDLTEQAKARLQALNAALKEMGFDGTVTSAKRNNPGIHSNHNLGTALDLVSRGNMAALAAGLGVAGFDATFEHKGQRNANGSIATGDHIHVDLLEAARQAAATSGGGGGAVDPNRAATSARAGALASALGAGHGRTKLSELAKEQQAFGKEMAEEAARRQSLMEGVGKAASDLTAKYHLLGAADVARLQALKEGNTAIEVRREGEKRLREQIAQQEGDVRNLRLGRDGGAIDARPGISSPLVLRLAGAEAERQRLESIAAGTAQLRSQIASTQDQIRGMRGDAERRESPDTRVGVSSPLALRLAGLADELKQLKEMSPYIADMKRFYEERAKLEADIASREEQNPFRRLAQAHPTANFLELVGFQMDQGADNRLKKRDDQNASLKEQIAQARGRLAEFFGGGKEQSVEAKFPLGDQALRGELTGLLDREKGLGAQRAADRQDADTTTRLREALADVDAKLGKATNTGTQYERTLARLNLATRTLTVDQRQLVQEIAEGDKRFERMQQLRAVATGVESIFAQSFRNLSKGFKGFFDSVLSGFEQMLQDMAAKYLASQLTGLLLRTVAGAFGGGGGGSALTAVGDVFGLQSHRALGGPVRRGGSYLVGEHGAEVVTMGGDGWVTPNHQMAGAGGGTVVHMTVVTRDASSFRQSSAQIASDMAARLDQVSRRNR